jgi:integrase
MRIIPESLRDYFGGKAVYKLSLKTNDYSEALKRYDEVHTNFTRKLFEAKAGQPVSDEINLFVVVGMFLHDTLDALEEGSGITEMLQSWLIEQADEENAFVEGIALGGFRFQLIERAVSEVLRGIRAKASMPTKKGKAKHSIYSQTLSEVAIRWAALPNQKRNSKTIYQYVSSVNRFEKWYRSALDRFPAAAGISKRDVNGYVKFLMRSNVAKATIQRELAGLRTVFRYGELTEDNPFDRVAARIEILGRSNVRSPFSDEKAKMLLARAKTSSDINLKWSVWLGLYSGFRLGEIATLRKEDIKSVESRRVIHLSKNPNRTLKTASAYRIVPLHPELTKAGFLTYVASLPKGEFLVRGEAVDKFGKRSAALSKRINRFIDSIAGEGRDLTFHSTRHTFITKMQMAGVRSDVRRAVVGHASRDVHDGYSHGEAITELYEAVQKVSYLKNSKSTSNNSPKR